MHTRNVKSILEFFLEITPATSMARRQIIDLPTSQPSTKPRSTASVIPWTVSLLSFFWLLSMNHKRPSSMLARESTTAWEDSKP